MKPKSGAVDQSQEQSNKFRSFLCQFQIGTQIRAAAKADLPGNEGKKQCCQIV